MQVAQIQPNTVQRPISVQRRFSFPSRRLVLLAPANAFIPKIFHDARESFQDHRTLLSELQRFRGRVYLADGAIEQSDLTDGRHVAAADDHSWHFIVHDPNGDIAGCIRYQAHDLGSLLLRLSVFNSSLAACPEWGPTLKRAVESEITLAKTRQLSFVEVGGWAVAEHVRGTAEPLKLGLVAYSLGRLMGGAVGLCGNSHPASLFVRQFCGGLVGVFWNTRGRPSQPTTTPGMRARWTFCDFILGIRIRAMSCGSRKSGSHCNALRAIRN